MLPKEETCGQCFPWGLFFPEKNSALREKGCCIELEVVNHPYSTPPPPPFPSPNERQWKWSCAHVRLVLLCSGWPEDASGSAWPVPRPVRDGPPRWHERRADQPRCRLRQPPQHVPADECGGCCCSRGGLWALPHGRWLWSIGGGGAWGGSPHASETKTQCPGLPPSSCSPSSTCRLLHSVTAKRFLLYCFCGWRKAVFRSRFSSSGDIWFSPTKVDFFFFGRRWNGSSSLQKPFHSFS